MSTPRYARNQENRLREDMEKLGPTPDMLQQVKLWCKKSKFPPASLVEKLPMSAYGRWDGDTGYAHLLATWDQPPNANGRDWHGNEAQFRDASLSLMQERYLCAFHKSRWRLYRIEDPESGVVREVDITADLRSVAREIAPVLDAEGLVVRSETVAKIVDYYMTYVGDAPRPVLCSGPDDDRQWCLHKIKVRPAEGLAAEFAGLSADERAQFMQAVAPATWSFLSRMIDAEAFAAWMYGLASLRFRGRQMLWLKGFGLDGKSLFFRAFADTVFGRTAKALAWATAKNADRWVNGMVEDKRFVYVGDCSNPRILLTETFKAISGEDEVTVEHKNKDPYAARLEAKIAVVSNFSPFIKGEVHSLSRILPIRMAPRDLSVPDDAQFKQKIIDEMPVFLAYGEWAYCERCRDDYEIKPNEAVEAWVRSRVLDANEELEAVLRKIVVLDRDETERVRPGSGFEVGRQDFYDALAKHVRGDTHKVAEVKDYLVSIGVQENERKCLYRGMRLRTDEDDQKEAANDERSAFDAVQDRRRLRGEEAA